MSVFESEYSTSDTVSISVSEYLNHIFIILTSNPTLSDMIDIICI